MKKFLFAMAAMSGLCNVYAEPAPVVGLWEKITVTGPGGKVVARTNYIFTNAKLTEATTFTAIKSTNPLTLICCMKVENLKPVDLNEVLDKYRMDTDFVSHMKSITGAPFMYEAVAAPKKDWNGLMTTILGDDDHPSGHPIYAPVVAAKLGDADEKLEKLELGPTKTKLDIKYLKQTSKATYRFTSQGKQIVLSEETYPH